jgi:hypothetical protein
MRSDLGQLRRASYRMSEVLRKMDSFVDASDPDVDVPNSIHACAHDFHASRIGKL